MGVISRYAKYIDADAVGLFHPNQVLAPFSAYRESTNYTVWKPQTPTGKGLRIRANAADSKPAIELDTGGNFALQADTNSDVIIYTSGTGRFKYGTYVAGAATESIGYFEQKDADGTLRKVMIQA